MKAIFSDLKLNRYFILDSRFTTKYYKSNKILDVKQNLHSRPFEIEFDILESEKKEDIAITVNINSFSLNRGKKTGGYDFSITARGFFTLENIEDIEEDKEIQYILYSALPMIISICRSHLGSITANGLYGVYTLPAIDLPAIVNDWFDEEQED